MKICGYCGNEYDEKEIRCPVCGSKLLKHTKGAETAADEYRRIEEEIKNKRKSRSMILGIGVGIIALIIFIAIASVVNYFNDPQRDIDKESKRLYEVAVQQIKDGDYDDAIETLDDINVSWSEYSKVEGKKIEAVKGHLTNKIEQYEASGDYAAVITYINRNIEDIDADAEISKIYDDSVEKYKANLMKKVDEYVRANDFTSAKSLLLTASNIIGDDNEIQDRLTDVSKKEILSTVTSYENDGNYAEAISYIYGNLEKIDNDSEILMKLSNCEQKYRDNIITTAENAYKSEGYQDAIEILKEALNILKKDDILLEQIEKYENLAPVSLLDLNAFYSDYDGGLDGRKKQIQSMKDKLGNTYENVLEYTYGDKEARDIYVINKEYKKFKGTLFVPEDRNANHDDWAYQDPFYFSVYGDDVLLYKSPKMTSKQYPVDFEIDISGVEQLSINWHGGACTWDYEICLSNAFLYK